MSPGCGWKSSWPPVADKLPPSPSGEVIVFRPSELVRGRVVPFRVVPGFPAVAEHDVGLESLVARDLHDGACELASRLNCSAMAFAGGHSLPPSLPAGLRWLNDRSSPISSLLRAS